MYYGENIMNKKDKKELERLADEQLELGKKSLLDHDYTQAEFYVKESLKNLKEAGCIEKYVKTLNILGIVYAIESDEGKAFDCYLESLANAEVMDSKYLKAMTYSNIGSCYQKMGRTGEAMKYYEDAKKELADPTVKEQESYEIWNMLNLINIKGASEQNESSSDVKIDKNSVILV